MADDKGLRAHVTPITLKHAILLQSRRRQASDYERSGLDELPVNKPFL